MDTPAQERVIESLERLNQNVERQNSMRHILLIGLIYGISFGIGSTLFTALAWNFLYGVAEDFPKLRPHIERIDSEPRP